MNDATHELVRYDAMCVAIAAAHEVDEVKDIFDKTLALQMYLHQARDTENERKVGEIKTRAARKGGDLLREMQKAKGGAEPGVGRRGATMPSDETTALPKRLSDHGISRDQSSQWQKLAAISDEDFEQLIQSGEGDPIPTVNGIIAAHEARRTPAQPRSPFLDDALWLWGCLNDFDRLGILKRDPNDLISVMIDIQREGATAMASRVVTWLERIKSK